MLLSSLCGECSLSPWKRLSGEKVGVAVWWMKLWQACGLVACVYTVLVGRSGKPAGSVCAVTAD